MFPQIVGRDAVEHGPARGSQHGREQLHDKRRFKIDKPAVGEQTGDHIGVLRRRFCRQRRQRPGWQAEVQADREDMPCPHAGTDSDHLQMFVLVGHDLVEQRHHGAAAAVHDRQAADLNDVELWQDGAYRCLGGCDYLLVDERLTHQSRDDVLRLVSPAQRRIGTIRFHGSALHAAALGAPLKMTVPTGSPASAALNCPALSPLTNWISRMCRAVSSRSSTARSTTRSSWSRASNSWTLMRGICWAAGSFLGSAV